MAHQARDSDEDADALRDLIREARSQPPLKPGEEAELLRRAAAGDEVSQERLIAVHLPAVVRLAAARSDEGLSLPDLVQEGSIGFIEAMRTFAASGQTDFAPFAEARDAIETEVSAVRDERLLITAAEDYDRTELALARELHRAPTEAELAEKLEWTVERTRYVALVVAGARKKHDEELLAFIDPAEIDLLDELDIDDPSEN
jgi:DNA-directed RNA polymerase sigma subunit (sigma70/sigma32)